jgi:alpha-1,6-mannosyltransferase
LTLLASAAALRRSHAAAVAWLVCAAVIFRCDTAVLLLPWAATALLFGRLTPRRLFWTGVAAAGPALAATVVIDSALWRRWLWPEWKVFAFNAVANRR